MRDFRLQRYEVTNEAYRRLVPDHPGEDELPAVDISWYAAYTYAAWLGGRLPTEAEWEYAARAGCRFDYCDRKGEEARLTDVAWYSGNSDFHLHPIGTREPNPWGLYDMHGNALEWVADWYGPYPAASQDNPWGPPSGVVRVLRGGSFRGRADGVRSAYRSIGDPWVGFRFRGFRVLLPFRPE